MVPLCPVPAAEWSRLGTALTLGRLSSTQLGLAPALPAPGASPARTAAQRRCGCPAPGLCAGRTSGRRLAPIPLSAPCLSRKALLGRSAEAHVSGAVSTPSHPLGVRSCQFHLWAVLTTLGLSTAPLLVAPDVTTDTLL